VLNCQLCTNYLYNWVYHKLQIACCPLAPGEKEIGLCLHQSVFAKTKKSRKFYLESLVFSMFLACLKSINWQAGFKYLRVFPWKCFLAAAASDVNHST